MKLKKLFKDIPEASLKGGKDVEISGLCANSNLAVPGNLFVALRGESFDGTQFIPDAVESGAVAVLTDLYDPFLKEVSQVIHPQPKEILVEVAKRFYENPVNDLFLVGITGTNGKTTSSFFIKHLLEGLTKKVGIIGTIEYLIGDNAYQSNLTTPDLLTNYKMLKEMVTAGCNSCVMEVSSHALSQKRVEGLEFDITIFTNLTSEHLDYHSSMEEYAQAKRKLFENQPSEKKGQATLAILNCDDPKFPFFKEKINGKALTYGFSEEADIRATAIDLEKGKTSATLCYRDQSAPFTIPFIGKFNVYNLLCAVAVGVHLGETLASLSTIFETLPQVRGRMEKIENPLGLSVFVDFAHTPDALENSLKALSEICEGKIITVFGCGGDRDEQKREKMGSIAEKLSGTLVVTSDNPRTENPDTIIEMILKGVHSQERCLVEPDRKVAIQKAISLARKEDMVLIAGKGHETYQIVGRRRIPFDDAQIARDICEEIASSPLV